MTTPAQSAAMMHAGAAAAGTVSAMQVALKARLAEIVAPFWAMATKSDAHRRVPTVVDGYLPFKAPEQRDFPFLLFYPLSGEDSPQGADESSRVTVGMTIGTYSDHDLGWVDPLLVVDAIRQSLLAEPLLKDTQYEHVGPLLWELPREQAFPQWFAYVTTNWQIPRPQRVETQRSPEGA